MPALFPIIAIVAVFIFISVHATATAPYDARHRDSRSSGSRRGSSRGYKDSSRGDYGGSGGGDRDYGRSRDYGSSQRGGSSRGRSQRREYGRSRY